MTKKKKLTSSISTVLIVACMLVGYYVLTFPTLADLINKIYNQNAILTYNNSMTSYSNDKIEAILKRCEIYNQEIYEEQKTSTFRYRGEKASDDEYESLPTSEESIGTIRIPKINVNLSVVHGTSSTLLQSSVGHLYGTSLPIAGENVHSVIAAHSALSTAKLFTDLEDLEEGDTFYVTVLNREYEYKVDSITVCTPDEDYKYEQVEEGKNYVTLYTCTPYGVNTHRLLVRGEFVGEAVVETANDGSLWSKLLEYWPIIKEGMKLGGVLLAPGVIALVYTTHERKKTNKKKEKEQGKC